MKKTLIVVDMQNDFIDMALGTKEAVAIETHEAALRTMEMCQVEIIDIG